jgi:hypothetical protein
MKEEMKKEMMINNIVKNIIQTAFLFNKYRFQFKASNSNN